MKTPLAVDLFSGGGGLTLGLKQAGFRVIGAVELEPLAVETYRKNHRRTKIWDTDIQDISLLSFKRALGLRKGKLDLLAGCPPCQGFSTLKTLNGSKRIRDPRNDLIFEFLRFIEGLMPKAIMMENVPGLAKDKRIKTFCRKLSDLGYDSEYTVLDVSQYGVPQRRWRTILLASRVGPVLWAEACDERSTVRRAIGGLPRPGKSGDHLHDICENRSADTMEMIRNIPKNGGSRASLNKKFQLSCHQKCDGFKDVYGRMAWNDVAPTITTGCVNPSKGRFLHPTQHRSITLREAALLQSFPANYFVSLSRGKFAAAEIIGNAIPPEFVRRHAAMVKQALTG